ncbi:meiotically up-regulated gene family-domain-containing protein [Xylaria bambusicola]|uniref:meiotically up-regulated gene family-domain-containing protein n=1 Tax=Xylaria bambusicola TaxID=326684 RepID=UPI002008DCF6|nr:meiotically up-regulated gene family-domain-containing protein [Xylaria bambusicola]KAI0509136.1 meiotically up-regulated gene family-domain-containing protein [Xylaria bambusicola]
MQFSQFIQLSAILAGAVYAIPSPLPNTIMLSNGNETVAVEVDGLDTRAIFGRSDTDCKGSYFCTNKQWFKDQCARAKDKLEDTIYTSGGAKSGVCDGWCGLFVKGKGCSATGAELANGYDLIRAGGCQACGSLYAGSCTITIDYVSGC